MKTIGFVFFYCLLVLNLTAQKLTIGNSIKGTVTDSLQKGPLEYATITVFAKGIKKPLNGTVTDKDGKYTINEIPSGNYEITFEFIGYKSVTIKDISLGKSASIVQMFHCFLKKVASKV